jgi:hypothetical protein
MPLSRLSKGEMETFTRPNPVELTKIFQFSYFELDIDVPSRIFWQLAELVADFWQLPCKG